MKKLILVVLFALVAGACGGSDDAASSDDSAAFASSETDDANTNATDDDPLSTTVDPSDLPPAPEAFVAVNTRDCAHTAAEPAGGNEAVTEVELPPDTKPEIEDDYLGEFDKLVTTDLIEGTGDEAIAGATVTMQYVGVLGADGTEFDASWNSGNPFTFSLGASQVIAGWDQGIEGMKVGGRRLLQIPSDLAYGDTARSEVIVADSDLVFVVDLLDVAGAPEPTPPIDDSYLGSFSELKIVDLVEGEGCEVQFGDIITVNYVGVEADTDEEFDSSWTRGEPFVVIAGRSQVIDGWNEGLIGMKVGGERILQIPAAMAYDESDLVFRVHLESLDEAPVAHLVEFDGDAPDDVEVTTLVEGSGDQETTEGSIIDANVVVMLHDSGTIVQSTWQQGVSTQLALEGGSLLPGLADGINGAKVGEVRQIILPTSVAYPDGVPPESGIAEGDALVFIIEVVKIIEG